MLDPLKHEVTRQDEEHLPNGITKLSVTRWTVRATSFQRIIDNYSYLMELWDHCLHHDKLNTEVKARVIGCQSQMYKFWLFFGLSLGQRFYSHTDNLSKTLQGTKMSATSSKRLENFTIEVFESLRNEESFNMLYNTICEKAKHHYFVAAPVLPRKRRAPNYSIIHFLDGYGQGSEAHNPKTPRDYYREIYYEVLDTFIFTLKERFDQPCFIAFENLESLLLKSLRNEDSLNEMSYLESTYSDDVEVEQIKVEMEMFRVMLKDVSIVCFDDIVNYLQTVPAENLKLIGNIVKIVKLLIVNPATSASAERTFSMARHIKTWMRSTMLQSRFNSLAVLKFDKDRTDSLDLLKVAIRFVNNESRMNAFGRFTEKDF